MHGFSRQCRCRRQQCRIALRLTGSHLHSDRHPIGVHVYRCGVVKHVCSLCLRFSALLKNRMRVRLSRCVLECWWECRWMSCVTTGRMTCKQLLGRRRRRRWRQQPNDAARKLLNCMFYASPRDSLLLRTMLPTTCGFFFCWSCTFVSGNVCLSENSTRRRRRSAGFGGCICAYMSDGRSDHLTARISVSRRTRD